jgi:hypothetical protein
MTPSCCLSPRLLCLPTPKDTLIYISTWPHWQPPCFPFTPHFLLDYLRIKGNHASPDWSIQPHFVVVISGLSDYRRVKETMRLPSWPYRIIRNRTVQHRWIYFLLNSVKVWTQLNGFWRSNFLVMNANDSFSPEGITFRDCTWHCRAPAGGPVA